MKPLLLTKNVTASETAKRRTLNVSWEVYSYIDKHCQSMEDTPDKILRRLLNIPTLEPRPWPRKKK